MGNKVNARHQSGVDAVRQIVIIAVACILVGVSAVTRASGSDQLSVEDSPVGTGVGGSDVFVAPDKPVRPGDGSRSDSAKLAAEKFLTDELVHQTVDASGADQLVVASRSAGDRNSTIVRFDYTSANGVPLYGGQALVEVTANKKIRTVNSSTSNRPFPSDQPSLTAAEAATRALTQVADAKSTTAQSLDVSPGELVFFDPAVVGAIGGPIKGVRLAWQFEVTDGKAIKYEILIDATSGEVLLAFNQIHGALDRKICDSHATEDDSCSSTDTGQHVRSEGDAPLGDTEADNAYQFFGEFYDMLDTWFDRDGHAGDGRMMRGNINVHEDGSPYQNAYYNGVQVVFGAGLATDDIVGHEWTHGLIDHTSRLIYYGESGAMNESIADVFGEFLDQRNDYDEATGSWQIGEDWKAIRSMTDPNQFGDPDTRLGRYWYDGSGDNGGVHINSGVGNKFAHLVTAGGGHNNYQVSGLGIEKAARVIYGANLLLTSSSDYQAYGNALNQACATLVGSHDIGNTDCAQVTTATQAVNIYTDPDAPPPPEPDDAAGDSLATTTELPASWTVRETLHSGDNDYWTFTTSTTRDISIILDELPTDYDLELYNAAGNLITYSENPASEAETITRTLNPGTYIARVYPWSSPKTDNYRLTVTPPEDTTPLPIPNPAPAPNPVPDPAPPVSSLPDSGTTTIDPPPSTTPPLVTKKLRKISGLTVQKNKKRLKLTWKQQQFNDRVYYEWKVLRKLAKSGNVRQTGWTTSMKPRAVLSVKDRGAKRFTDGALYVFKIRAVSSTDSGKTIKKRYRT